MTVPRIWVRHTRYKGVVRVVAFAKGEPVAIYLHDYAPMNAKKLSKLKLTIKNALKLRY